MVEIDEHILKFIWKYKRPGITKTTLKKDKFGGPTFKTHYTQTYIDNDF